MASPDAARLRRLRRLARIRAIERDQAQREVAITEATLAQLNRLAERTEALAASYARQPGPVDAAALATGVRFENGLRAIAGTARVDGDAARSAADHRQQLLAEAERRRTATADRVGAAQRTLFSRRWDAPTGARRAFGTALEE